ncbi:MAG: hypothetical protein AB1656_05195 [Candidatus Omnitrophota bacterium]
MKKWYYSKTIWGAIFVLIGVTAQATGHQFALEDQQTAVNLVTGIIEAIGGLMAIYGRVKAEGVIK